MPASEKDYSKIKSYQEEAASKTQEASAASGAAITLGDQVMDAVRKARTERGVSKLATDVGNVSGQLVSDPTGIRERTSGVVDPFSVNALTSNARAQNMETLGTISMQEKQNQGSLDEVIQAGANKLKARATQLLAEAEKAMADASSLEQEYQRSFQEKQYEEGVRQFNESQKPKGSGSTVEKETEELSSWATTFASSLSPEDRASFYEDYNGLLKDKFSESSIKAQLTSLYNSKVSNTTQTEIPTSYTGQGALETWSGIYNNQTSNNVREKGLVGVDTGITGLLKKLFNK